MRKRRRGRGSRIRRSTFVVRRSKKKNSTSSSTTSLQKKTTQQLVWNLRRHALSLEKTLRHRVLRWCSKFEAEKESPALVWKKGRNQHARALLAGLRRGLLPAPFDAGPPQEPLGAGVPVACAVAVGLDSRGKTKAKSKRPLLVVPGTDALRLAPPLLRCERAEEAAGEQEQPSSSSAAACAFSRVHLPSRVELAASLGAATEKIAELEWRLGEKERRSRAREWESGVAAARASAALLRSFDHDEEEVGAVERRAMKARAPAFAAAAASPLPALPPSPSPVKTQAATAAKAPLPLPLRRPKVGFVAPTPPPQMKKKQQEDLIPSVSLEELSRRISALAPQF